MLDKFFKLKENNTDVKKEIIAGVITFMTMAYIIFVNPAILQVAGLPFAATAAATCAVSAICTILMGIYTNYPIALAPGMGLNAFLAFTVCKTMGYSWQVGMAVVFVEGVIIGILVLTRVREWIMDAIPLSLKKAISVGIGLFISFIGLKESGIIVSHPATFVGQGDLSQPTVLVAIIGLVITAFLMSLKIQGALLWGILLTTLIAIPFGVITVPSSLFQMPTFETFGQFTVGLKDALTLSMATTIFAFLLSDFFDTMGTVIGIGSQAGFLDKQGKLPRLRRVLLIDSLGAVLGGVFSSSSATSYIESASGVAQGGRTGLTNVVCGLLFLIALFFSPLAQMIGGGYKTPDGVYLHPITSPCLIVVGFLMMTVIKDIPWDNFDEALPCFLTIIIMPLTFSISHGIGWGFIMYTLIKLLTGKIREIHPLMIIVSIFFAIGFSPLVPK